LRDYKLWAALTILGLALLFSCGKKQGPKPVAHFPDTVVDSQLLVTVNQRPITGRDLRVFSVFFSSPRADTLSRSAWNEQLLSRLIDRTLIWQEAVANGSVVPEAVLTQTISSFIGSVGGEEAFNDFLARAGIDREEFAATVQRDLLIRDFIENTFIPQVKVTDEDARGYYDAHRDRFQAPDSVRARHILVRVYATDPDSVRRAKRERIEEILRRVQKGEDFAELARRYSDDPSGKRGGDLGYFPRGAMVAPFDSAAFALEVGQVSGVVATPFGYHLIKVEDKKPGKMMTFQEVKDVLKKRLVDMKVAELIEKHLQEIRRVAIIDKNY